MYQAETQGQGLASVNKTLTTRAAVCAALTLAGLSPLAASALPVIPGATGYGTSTTAGRGGTVYRVTTLAESGAGSLKECIDHKGPRVCVFEVSGTIKLTKDLPVRNTNLTIAGQTAPSPGIMLRGASLVVKTSDVLVQHIRVRPGDAPGDPYPENRDAIRVDGDEGAPITRNVVIDHCSFSWSIDEMASAWQNWDNITFSNNIFGEALNDSLHPKGPHGYGVLFGPVDGHVTLSGNLLAHMVERNPLTNATSAVIVNNVIYNWSTMAVDLQSQKGAITKNTVVGNVFIKGADYKTNSPVELRAAGGGLPSGSKVYLDDNQAQESSSDPWSVASSMFGDLVMANYKASTPPSWPSGMTRLPTSNNVTLTNVLKWAGARPADRDTVDTRIVNSVRNGTGRIINCVSNDGSARCKLNAGGWPNMAQNRRALTLPANPNTVTASGYTNLELWLQRMASEVEGLPTTTPKAPVLAQSAE
ncbi:MAG: polysaccharide lyase family 1 protein [Povalibacter sp.]